MEEEGEDEGKREVEEEEEEGEDEGKREVEEEEEGEDEGKTEMEEEEGEDEGKREVEEEEDEGEKRLKNGEEDMEVGKVTMEEGHSEALKDGLSFEEEAVKQADPEKKEGDGSAQKQNGFHGDQDSSIEERTEMEETK